MKAILLFSLSTLFAMVSFAQNTQIKGRIIDAENGNPLSNATVMVAGLKGTTTDKNGQFYLECKDSIVISISYIGYENYKQKVACNKDLNIALKYTSVNLNMVEVTANSNSNKATLYQPIAVAQIGETEIKRGTGLQMDDAINANMAGVYMQRRTFSAGQQFNIRGYGNGARGTNGINSNFDGQGYKVYLNGIPITDAEGITLMDDIDFGSIGNVEVIKGPAGTLYGQAIAGVVNMKTLKPKPGTSSIGQEVIIGSYGLQRYTTSLQMGKEKSSILLNYGKQKYDGFMPHTKSDKDFVNFFGEFTPNEKQTINSYFGYSRSNDDRNGELTIGQFENLDYSGNPAYIKNNAHSNVMTFRTGVGHTYRFRDNISNTTSIFGTGLISNVSSAGGWTDKSSINYGLRSTFDTRFTLASNFSVSGITGVEAQIQNAQTQGYPMVADSFNLTGYNIIGALRSNQYTVSKTISAFTEWTLAMSNDFSVTAGLGYSSLGIELNDRFFVASNNNPSNPKGTQKPSQYNKNFNNMFSPHLAINKVISKQVSVYASYSRAYKAPVSSYFFVPLTGEVLTDLKPELGTQYELGSKGTLWNDRLNFQIAGFYTKYTDKMTTIAVPNAANTATSYVYVANAGEQENLGIEISLKGDAYKSDNFVKSITPFTNLTYSHFRYGDFKYQVLSSDKKSTVEADFSNNIVVGTPPIVFNAGFDLATKPGLYMNLTYSYRDKMFYTSDNKNETKPFNLLNTKIGYSHTIIQHISIDAYLGINNITQNQNYAMVFLNQLPDAYIPAPREANYFGGVNLKYNF